MSYCVSRFHTVRRRTVEVKVGSVGVGGSHPIRFTVVNKDDPRVVVVEDERFWMP